jgi:hypothetical protein
MLGIIASTDPPRWQKQTKWLAPAMLCSSALLMFACSGAHSPENATGVRALYRSVGLDASGGAFNDICLTYMDEQLRDKLKAAGTRCAAGTFERWAEKVRRSNVAPGIRIVVSGPEAVVYDGVEPERAVYAEGQWRLADVPELTTPRRATAR